MKHWYLLLAFATSLACGCGGSESTTASHNEDNVTSNDGNRQQDAAVEERTDAEVGKGTEKKVKKRLQVFDPKAMMLIAGGGKDLPPPDMTVTTLTLEDAEAIRNEIDGLEIVSPMAWRLQMSVKHDVNQYQAIVWGVEPSWHRAWKWHAAEGEEVCADDVATAGRVCVIGRTIQKELFGDADPIGQRIYVNKVALMVKGVLEKRGTSPMGGDFDNKVVLPITTAMRRVMNVDYVGAIRIITEDPNWMSEQANEIRKLIHDRHGSNPSEEDDFRIITAEIIGKKGETKR